jgi:hypothetical protein
MPPAWPIGRQARSQSGRWSDAEKGALIPAVGEQDARADRKDVLVAIAPDLIRADLADDPLVTAKPLQRLGAEVKRVAELVTGERACLDRRLDLADGHIEVRILAPAGDVRGRAK